MRFFGTTKKIAYAGNLEGERVLPVQAATALLYVASGLIGCALFLAAQYALVIGAVPIVIDPIDERLALARTLGIPFGIVDLSLAPTPNVGDSVGEIFQSLGLLAIGQAAAVDRLVDSLQVDSGEAGRRLGWVPKVGVEEGLQRTLAWYASRRH